MDGTESGMGSEATRRQFFGLAALTTTGVVLSGVGVPPAAATPPSGALTREALAQGRLADGVTMATNGPSDFHIHRVVVEPGADSGWHTHPGTALDIVTAGTVTVYVDGDGCEPRQVGPGEAVFLPAGVAHLARNEGSGPAEIYVTYLVAAGAEPRGDVAAPEGCPA